MVALVTEGVGEEGCGESRQAGCEGSADLCRLSGREQAHHPHQVVGAADQVARHLGFVQADIACPAEATRRFQPAKYLLNGLFTNDKFCCSRPARLRLKWWHRAYRDR